MKKSLLIFLTCLAGVLHADGLALKTTPTLLEEANVSGLVSNLSKTTTASARVNKLLYQSADKFTDLTSGKSGFVTVAEDANGKIGAYVDEVGRVAKGGDIISDVKYNKILNDLKGGAVPSKFSRYGVTLEEEAALRFYTTNDGYANLNKALRGEVELTSDLLAQKKLMDNAITKLPKEQGKTVFRGLGKPESDFAKQLKVGDEFTHKDFTSSSLVEEEAELLAKDNVLYIIKSKNGVSIKEISAEAREAEVLFKSGARFKVTDVTFKPRFDPDDPLIKWVSIDEL